MAIQLPDNFDNEFGFSDYDGDADHQPLPAAYLANRHVDIRIFDVTGQTRSRTMTDLENPVEEMVDLDGDTMVAIENVQITPGETWSTTGTGGVISATTSEDGHAGIGPWFAYGGWKGLKFDCNGATLNKFLTSDWPLGSTGLEVDISQMNTLSLVIDDSGLTNTGKVATVTIQLNSHPLGAFGNGVDSNVITMTQTGKEWHAAISDITGSCDLTKVTGIKLNIKDDTTHHPANTDILYIFAIRAYVTGYDPSIGVDINTRQNAVMMPVTLNLLAPSVPRNLVRGSITNDPSDPRTQDGSARLIVRTGLLTATAPNYNTFGLIFREDRANDHFLIVYLDVASDNVQWRAEWHDGGFVAETFGPFPIGSTAMAALFAQNYFIFSVDVRSLTITVNLYQSDGNEHLDALVYTDAITADSISTLRGRQGWFASFYDRDMQIQQFYAFALAYSTLITRAQLSFTPVDGCQLTAAYSIDDNLFVDFTSTPVAPVIDNQRSLSADGSYLTSGPIFSNNFLIFNFEQAYIEFDMWVPSQVTPENQPRLVLRSPFSSTDITFPPLDLQGNQWNHVFIDLAETQAAGGISYNVFLERTQGQGTTYSWNVDNFVIGVRNVAWRARSLSTGDWIEFRDTVNDDGAGVHFPHDQRGKELQIQAEALTQTAWIGPFTYKPRYAQLGKPTYLK